MADFTQSVLCSNGHSYLINYSVMPPDLFTDDPDILQEFNGVCVYDIVLQIFPIEGDHSYLSKSVNKYADLITISSYIFDFLEENKDVILYFFCDQKNNLYYNSKNKSITCQAFRSSLFSTMFDRHIKSVGTKEYQNTVVEINGIEETFYTHLIARRKFSKKIERISSLLEKMKKRD